MTKQTCIAFTPEQLDGIDKHRFIRHVKRSGLVRIAVAEFLERAKSERKENKNETSETK